MTKRKPRDASDANGLPKMPPLRLDSLQRLRLEMTLIYKEAKAARRDVGDASKLVFMLKEIGRCISDSELEKRIEELERLAGSRP